MAENCPEDFTCPISLELMTDPVILGTTGRTFQREHIQFWLSTHDTNPLTNEALTPNEKILIPNYALRGAIGAYINQEAGTVIPFNEISVSREIGNGPSKTVYCGMWTAQNQEVAVLHFQDKNLCAKERRMFIKVCFHPHVLRFLGSTHFDGSSDTDALITELAPMGSLSTCLINLALTGVSIPMSQKLLIGEQIADGMSSIHGQNIIHRHLAARNIMVFNLDPTDIPATTVKISDYVMAEAIGVDGFFSAENPTTIPSRWLSPLVLQQRVWSKHSDVWSFGVLMWEILTNGNIPYEDILSDEDIRTQVISGELILKCPGGCPPPVWALVQRCLHPLPQERPPFTEIKVCLQYLRLECHRTVLSRPLSPASVLTETETETKVETEADGSGEGIQAEQFDDNAVSDLYIKSLCCCNIEAFNLLLEIGQAGNPLAKGMACVVLFKGLCCDERDTPRATQLFSECQEWLHQASAPYLNNPYAQFILGNCYHSGIGVSRSSGRAVEYYEMSAEQGYAVAQTKLGMCYEKGGMVSCNVREAARLYQLAADQNYPMAQNNLGLCYKKGLGVTKDLTQAVRYFKLAAQQGCSIAQNNLGICYAKGSGVERDDTVAFRLYRLAMKENYLPGVCHNLAVCYHKGNGVVQNFEEAVRLYRRDADRGYAKAQYNLGVCYATGAGVEKNLEEANRWFGLAKDGGYVESRSCYHHAKSVDF